MQYYKNFIQQLMTGLRVQHNDIFDGFLTKVLNLDFIGSYNSATYMGTLHIAGN